MLYMSLGEMLDALRIEARISQNPSHGLTLRDPHTYLLNRVQSDLFINFEWPSLKTSEILDVDPGQRYLAYPEGMTFETVQTIYALQPSGDYRPTVQGIGPTQLNERDPTDPTARQAPIQRWDNYVPPAGATEHNMFEIWPVPDVATKLYLKGSRAPTKLVNDADMSTLDGMAIVLHAAAEILAGQKAEDAALKLNKAQERVRMLKVRQSSGDNREWVLSGPSGYPRAARRGIDYIE